MKKIFTLLSTVSILAFAQETISFETSEGYVEGSLVGQNNWTGTPCGEGCELEGQTIQTTYVSDGAMAFQNSVDTRFGVQSGTIVGAFYNPTEPLANDNTILSFDYMIDAANAGTYSVFGGNLSEADPGYVLYVMRLLFTPDGMVMVQGPDGAEEASTWTPGEWNRYKIEMGAFGQVNYYQNDELIGTAELLNSVAVEDIRFAHTNNPGSNAYVDNFRVNNEPTASVNDISTAKSYIYPNPVKDELNVRLYGGNRLESVQVFNVVGKQVNAQLINGKVSFSGLPQGVYMLQLKTTEGVINKKVIKK